MTINTGAPDWQSAIVNTQALLATVTGGGTTATVTLPPNTATLVVFTLSPINLDDITVTCTGTTTGVTYPGSLRGPPPLIDTYYTRYFAVSPALDPQVTITFASAPYSTWYVVATTGIDTVDVPALSGLVAQGGATGNAYGLVVYGTDFATNTPFFTDALGRLMPFPSAASGFLGGVSGPQALVAGTATNPLYVTGFDIVIGSGGTAGEWQLLDNGLQIAVGWCNAGGSDHVALQNYYLTDALTGDFPVGPCDISYRYTVSPFI